MGKYDTDQLGSRMKSHEKGADFKLEPRKPVIIRIDGNRFSRLTKPLPKPSYHFLNLMAQAMYRTADDIEGCVFGYTQSDEVTLVLKNDQSEESQPWFGNRIQKIASLSASMMTMHMFREYYSLGADNPLRKQCGDNPRFAFDSRVWTVPDEMEMFNTLYWRQLDCIKNAISMVVYYKLIENPLSKLLTQ